MLERIIELTAENLGADAATITAETSFKEDLEQITTVADVMNYLTEHQA